MNLSKSVSMFTMKQVEDPDWLTGVALVIKEP